MSGLTVIDSTPVKSWFVKVDVKSTIGYCLRSSSVSLYVHRDRTDYYYCTMGLGAQDGCLDFQQQQQKQQQQQQQNLLNSASVRGPASFYSPYPPSTPLHSLPAPHPHPPPIVAISFCESLTFQGVYRYSTTLWSSNLSKASVSLSPVRVRVRFPGGFQRSFSVALRPPQ